MLSHHARHPHQTRRQGLGRRARRGEAGAVLVLVAACTTLLVTAVAFTVDLGRISTTRADLQRTADVTALDLGRRLNGRTTSAIVADPAWAAALTSSLGRNGFTVGGTKVATVRIGRWDPRTETFTPTAGATVPDSVEVNLTDRVEYEFAPGGAVTSRRSIASNRPTAQFQLGSYAARLDSSTSPILQPLLGDIVGVTAGGYGGLVGGRVALGDLLQELDLDIGTPDEVMATSVTLAQLLAAEAAVLRNHGDALRADLLQQTILNLPNPSATIPLAQLMTLGVGTDAGAASAEIDAFDIFTAAAFISNGTNFLDVPTAGLALGTLAVTQAQVQVIQGPVTVSGGVGASGSTSQVTVRLKVSTNVPALASVDVDLVLQSANATATISALRCGAPQELDIDVRTGLLSVAAPIRALVRILGIDVANVQLTAAVSKPGGAVPFAFDFPPDPFHVARQVPSAGLNLGAATVTTQRVDVLFLPLGGLVDGVLSTVLSTVITPLLTTVDTVLLTPLLKALGTTVAGADITPLRVGCNGTTLVG